MDKRVYRLLCGAGLEDIVIPKDEFVKEHRRLIKLLGESDDARMRKEAKSQQKELDMKGGSWQSGFIARMMGENRIKNKGTYKPANSLPEGSTMKDPVHFQFAKMPSAKRSPFINRHFGSEKAKFERKRELKEPLPEEPFKKKFEVKKPVGKRPPRDLDANLQKRFLESLQLQKLRDTLFRAQGRPESVGKKFTGVKFGTRALIIDEILRLRAERKKLESLSMAELSKLAGSGRMGGGEGEDKSAMIDKIIRMRALAEEESTPKPTIKKPRVVKPKEPKAPKEPKVKAESPKVKAEEPEPFDIRLINDVFYAVKDGDVYEWNTLSEKPGDRVGTLKPDGSIDFANDKTPYELVMIDGEFYAIRNGIGYEYDEIEEKAGKEVGYWPTGKYDAIFGPGGSESPLFQYRWKDDGAVWLDPKTKTLYKRRYVKRAWGEEARTKSPWEWDKLGVVGEGKLASVKMAEKLEWKVGRDREKEREYAGRLKDSDKAHEIHKRLERFDNDYDDYLRK